MCPFKASVCCQHEERINKNLELYTSGKLMASMQELLITKWADEAWQEVNTGRRKHCRAEFYQVWHRDCHRRLRGWKSNIEGIPGYIIPKPDSSSEETKEDEIGEESDKRDSNSHNNDESAWNYLLFKWDHALGLCAIMFWVWNMQFQNQYGSCWEDQLWRLHWVRSVAPAPHPCIGPPVYRSRQKAIWRQSGPGPINGLLQYCPNFSMAFGKRFQNDFFLSKAGL